MLLLQLLRHTMHPPFCYWELSLQPVSKRAVLTGSQFLEGGCLEREGWLFSRGLYIKNKLKSEIFNNKKGL